TLCMVDTAGKLLKGLLNWRVVEAFEVEGGISNHPHSVRAGSSTNGVVGKVFSRLQADFA
ncbi:hypothetical protein J6590_102409, partial [Homalodisca vitripennis]